ncbi:MAG: outer membrane protein transport protein [Oligoflexia bacterium]|nr:outer membrane protein transport protein [Oligoflexia bacterium]
MRPLLIFVGFAYLFFISSNVYAAGFEKAVLWSGKEAGYGVASVSKISGSQSIAINPAGLAASSDVSLNFSPTWVSIDGHVVSANRTEKTDHNFSPVGEFSMNYKVMDRLGVGIGAYVAGGSKAIYDGVDFTGSYAALGSFRPRIVTDFSVIEYALGFGYEIQPGLRIGAAWRILEAKGGLSTAKALVNVPAVTYVNIYDAKDTKYDGFRLGVQYQSPNDDWGIGASFRNAVDVVAEGQINGEARLTGSGNTTTATFRPGASIGTTFPWALSFGGNLKLSNFLILGAADYVNYKNNQELKITGTLNNNALPNIPLRWKNMWNIRIGTEYDGINAWKLRAGYILTTKVTSDTDARATLSPAGTGHTLTAGMGYAFLENLDFDGAFEYAFNSASGSMTSGTTGTGTSQSRELLSGVSTETKASVIAIHTGVTYKF